jgi:hypothetical protein
VILNDDIASHRKMLLAGKLIGGTGGASRALGLYVAAVGYARKHFTDGFVDDEFLTNFQLDRDAKRVAKALSSRRVKLFESRRGGYVIHDFHDHNAKAEKLKEKKKLAAQRQARKRAKDKGQTDPPPSPPSNGSGQPVTQPVTRDVPRDPEKEKDLDPVRTPYVPTPDVLPTGGSRSRNDARASHAPLVQSPLAMRSYAYPNDVVGVPNFAHSRFLTRLVNAGAARDVAERRLFDWYDEVCTKFRGQAIGDREGDFWDKRFEEWQGSTPRLVSSKPSVGATAQSYVERRRSGQL